MEDSTPSLLTSGDVVRHPHHLQLQPAASNSFLSPSSALVHATSESSHQQWESDQGHEEEKPRPYRTSLIQALRERFPNGPPDVYDEFIRVSLNDIPPDAMDNSVQEFERPPATKRLTRMTSQLWSAVAGSITSRPSLPLHAPRPVISHPRPIQSTPLKRRRSALSPSPVQYYTDSFIGIGPPPPLPSPSDIIDIRPRSRNTTNSTNSHSHSSSHHHKDRITTEITRPAPVSPTRPEIATKNSIVFPPYAHGRKKIVRIITPGAMPPPLAISTPPMNTPMSSPSMSRFATMTYSINSFLSYIAHILHFYDPAESLFVLGFVTGPQTWLLGGFYLPSVDKRDKKSRLRIWVDRQVEEIRDSIPRKKGSKVPDDLLDRLEQVSAGLTSSSFEIGRRTATTSNASRIDVLTRPIEAVPTGLDANAHLDLDRMERGSPIIILPRYMRSSRAVWDGSKNGHRGDYEGDEISVNIMPSRWIRRCRIAAVISGMIVLALFITSLTVVCLH